MRVVAVIPARGGSKGVPRKNIRLLGGKPLIHYSIETAKQIELIDRIVVSTDSPEIADVVGDPALVPFLRPASLALDDTPDLPVFQHVLDWLRRTENCEPEILVHLRPTSPLRRADSVRDGIRLLLDNPDAESVRGVCLPSQNPFKMWRIEGGFLQPLIQTGLPEAFNMPRQSLPEVWWQSAAVDVVRARVVRSGSMTGSRILPLKMSEVDSVDIDSPLDFTFAEMLLGQRHPRG
jgi:CMP-N,N'-diacetyllegionaminic acid synthase